jgi:hypothetical protein
MSNKVDQILDDLEKLSEKEMKEVFDKILKDQDEYEKHLDDIKERGDLVDEKYYQWVYFNGKWNYVRDRGKEIIEKFGIDIYSILSEIKKEEE